MYLGYRLREFLFSFLFSFLFDSGFSNQIENSSFRIWVCPPVQLTESNHVFSLIFAADFLYNLNISPSQQINLIKKTASSLTHNFLFPFFCTQIFYLFAFKHFWLKSNFPYQFWRFLFISMSWNSFLFHVFPIIAYIF